MKDYQPPKDLLKDRAILVTGAGDGIGKTAALSFAEHGAHVILLGRTEEKLTAVYDSIKANGHPQAAIVPMDLATPDIEQYKRLAELIRDEFGRLDGLLHNAALLGGLTPLADYDLIQWQAVLQVNLQAPYLLTRHCLELLKASSDASVIFTTADVGSRGRAYWGAYGIAAAGVERMMQTWADELENTTNIRLNSLDPGIVRTGMYKQAFIEDDQHLPVEPGAIMPVYLYLMGPDSRGITSQLFHAQMEFTLTNRNR